MEALHVMWLSSFDFFFNRCVESQHCLRSKRIFSVFAMFFILFCYNSVQKIYTNIGHGERHILPRRAN